MSSLALFPLMMPAGESNVPVKVPRIDSSTATTSYDSSPKDGSCRTSHSAYCGFGHARASAAVAQPVAAIEMNWSLPWGKPLSK